jgi:hypothetical protein
MAAGTLQINAVHATAGVDETPAGALAGTIAAGLRRQLLKVAWPSAKQVRLQITCDGRDYRYNHHSCLTFKLTQQKQSAANGQMRSITQLACAPR